MLIGSEAVRGRVADYDGQGRESRWPGVRHRDVVQEI